MSNDWGIRRKIRVTEKACESIKKLRKEHRRFDEQWEGLKWLLERNPEKSQPMRLENQGGVYYAMRKYGDPDYDLVELAVVFTYDDREVTIYGVTTLNPGDS